MIAQLFHHPELLKLAAVSIMLVCAIVLVILALGRVRKQLVPGARDETKDSIAGEGNLFKLAAYEGVIRKLKEQERELEKLRKAEREQANESASMSEAVLSNLGSGVVLFNTSNLVRQANPAAKSLLGYASVSGLHTRDIFSGVSSLRMPLAMMDNNTQEIDWSENGVGPLLKAIERCIRRGDLFRRIEADYRTPAGETRVLGLTLSPIRNSSGEAMGAAALISDLTEITQLSQQMQLRENMAALGEMSAGIAHEFKNSLATISGYAQMLEKEGLSGTTQEFSEKITKETGALARIVNDFLEFAKPQGAQRDIVDLRTVLEDCAVELNADIDLAGCPERMEMRGDATALHQAFSNLMRNSMQAAAPGTNSRTTAKATVNEGSTSLILSDNGRGISPEELPKIFIPFFTTKAEGTGLGLALVQRIIHEHGGAIHVASSPAGTAFTITLPHAFEREKLG